MISYSFRVVSYNEKIYDIEIQYLLAFLIYVFTKIILFVYFIMLYYMVCLSISAYFIAENVHSLLSVQ